MVKLLVWKLTPNLPALLKIELDGHSIGLNDSKAEHAVTTASYLGFTLREQSSTNALSPAFAKHP
jgi:hypothetical protein